MQYHKINNAELSSILGGEVTGYLVTVLHVLGSLSNDDGDNYKNVLDHFYRNICIVCLQETL